MKKKILIIGSGGREHAIGIALKKNNNCDLFFTPGNGGTQSIGKNINAFPTTQLIEFVKTNQITLTIVGPEVPLSEGIVNKFQKENLPIIGPSKQGALLESSKKWAKEFMKKNNIPTGAYQSFTNIDQALAYCNNQSFPIVIKADGLAAGKGVTIAQSFDEAKTALIDCLTNNKFSDSGKTVIIEEFLKGEEASIFAFTDGKTILPMIAAQDHKAIYDGDKGPNTGGMGAYAPAPLITNELYKKINNEVFIPVLKGLQKENINYKGIIYAGLMIKDNQPMIIEFNVRFGDPETQIVLPLLKTNLLEIFEAIQNEELDKITLEWTDQYAVCVVLASKGYPNQHEKNKKITINTQENQNNIIHAGTTIKNNQLLSNGGRVMGTIGVSDQLNDAIKKSYALVEKIEFENKYYRTDIGQKALKLTEKPLYK